MLFVADLVCFVSSLCEVDDIFSWWVTDLFSKEVLEVIHELKDKLYHTAKFTFTWQQILFIFHTTDSLILS